MEKDKKKKKKNMLTRYNDAEAKGSVKFTAIKTGVDVVAGSVVGGGLGALFGIWSPILGLILIGAGHALGDKSGVLRVAGAATMAYGIAKAVENRSATTEASVNGVSLGSLADGAKGRLINFKDNWLKATFLDKLVSKKEESTEEGDPTIGAIDLSELDIIDSMVEDSAINFEMQNIANEDSFEDEDEDEEFSEEEDFEEEEDLEGLDYSLIEEEIDFSNI